MDSALPASEFDSAVTVPRPSGPRGSAVCTECYDVHMGQEISARDLRNETAAIVERVARGERLVLTVNRRPVADVVPHEPRRSPWVNASVLRDIVRSSGADAGLLQDLAEVRGALVDP